MLRKAKATKRTAPSKTIESVESRPLSPEVPMGSPVEVAENEKVDSEAVL
jgi:hypothetical protein